MTTLRKTALHHVHVGLGAKMVKFAGYEMPVRYTSDIEEHRNVRENCGVFDVSHMGEFYVRGKGAAELLQRVSSNDTSKLFVGKAQYACLPNDTGGIVDDFLTYQMGEEEYLLVVNASNIAKDWEWINAHNSFGAELEDVSDQLSLLAVQGPKATALLQTLTDLPLAEMGFYTFKVGTLAGVDNVIVSATGYTGAGGFELYVENAHAEKVWNALFEAGEPFGLKPTGLAARDTLRLEMGYCLYGNDIDDSTSPIEAGLGWVTKPETGFVNSEALAKQKAEGVSRKLVGFELLDKGVPRAGYPILSPDGEQIGAVTSGTLSPMLKKGVGLGYIDKAYAKSGNDILIGVRNRQLKAVTARPPFYKA